MNNIWSNNKYINITMNILLFLLGINFMHYAQIVVPIMCLILFIDNKCKFKVNSIVTFVILCLFGVSFLIFGTSLGLYRFIGLFLPMAYYVGSNLYEPNENKIKTIIYIISLAMISHLFLNFICDFVVRGTEFFFRNSHLDFWTCDENPTTQTAVYYIFIIGTIYYIFVYETNKPIRTTAIVCFFFSFLYLLALGRRTPVFMFVPVMFASLIADYFVIKNKNKNSRMFLIFLFIVAIISTLLVLTVVFNLFGLGDKLFFLGLIRKFYTSKIYTTRDDIFFNTLSYASTHYLGGQEISFILGYGPHELWLDVFDSAGVVSYTLMVVYSIITLVTMIKAIKNNKLSKSFRLLVFTLLLTITIQFFLEPIMNGSSVVLLCVIIIFSSLECLQLK